MKDHAVVEDQELPRKTPVQFYKELEERYLYHKETADSHVRNFKPIGFVLGLSVPILSALLTFSMKIDLMATAGVPVALGIFLTLLTIMNSVLKPDERFGRGVQYSIALHDWKRELDICMAEIATDDEKAFHAAIRDMDKKLSLIGEKMAEGWVPKVKS